MNRISLNGTWERLIGGRRIDFVPVPGSYPLVGECTLELSFACPESFKAASARYALCTDGVLASADFILNGKPIGTAGPHVPYRFELPPELLQPHNTIQARIRDISAPFGTVPGRRGDGGLIRDVWIERRPACFIEHFAFRAEFDAQLVEARCTVSVALNGKTSDSVEVELSERATGQLVVKAAARAGEPISFAVARPRLWSPERADLYTLTVRLTGPQRDEVQDIVGFRKLEIRGRDFYLNGERLLLKGVCRHEFNEAEGYTRTAESVRRELAMIKHSGFNFVRLVHSPQAPVVARLAAELGLLVSEEPGACFQNLGDEMISTASLEALGRLIQRDRNCPSIFAWLIYNECDPQPDYGRRAGQLCRALDPDCLISFADCSGQHDKIKAMVEAGNLSFYGINIYSGSLDTYLERMRIFTDRPMVLTEWGGCVAQGNARTLDNLCEFFAHTAQETSPERLAGCCFWCWQDYEERNRGGIAAPEGYTIEGLVDVRGRPHADLLRVSQLCFDMDHPPLTPKPPVEVLSQAPARTEKWSPVPLDRVAGDQTAVEKELAKIRRHFSHIWPHFGQLQVAGIGFLCCDASGARYPLLLGRERPEIVIPVERKVRRLAVLGHVDFKHGYPCSTHIINWNTPDLPQTYGAPASEYEFVFDDGSIVQPLQHGVHILRANNFSRWWRTAPRAPETVPALQAVVDPAFESMRFDLWEKEFPETKVLRLIRWKLKDTDSVQALLAVSVCD